MTTTTETGVTTHISRVYIKAAPEAIWEAITDPEWNKRYGYQSPSEYDLRPGGAYRVLATAAMREQGGAPVVIIEGEVIEVDPPHKLVQTWHALFGPETTAEPFTRLTWEIEAGDCGVTRLTVTHDLTGAPVTAALVTGTIPNAGGGWSFMLSDLKTLLETGHPFSG
jgi:uncharacterized protein YndB with AHSA1/START domain